MSLQESVTDNKYDVVVIGGGPNGMTAAAYLTRAGLDVLVLEKLRETGGGMVTRELGGFRINHHATYMMLAELMPPYHDLDLSDWGVEFYRPEHQMAFLFEDGNSLIFWTDPDRSAESIKQISSSDANSFQRMYAEFEEMFDEFLLPATYWPPLDPIAQTQHLQGSDELGQLIGEISEMTPLEILDHYGFENEKVRGALLYTIMMFGLEPDEVVGFLVPIYITRLMQCAFVQGGTHHLASCLRKVVETSGGQVFTGAEVTKVEYEDGKTKGVKLSDGTQVSARSVISTLNPEQNFLELLSDVETEGLGDVKDSAERWDWEGRSLFTAHRGIIGEPPKYKDYPDAVSSCANVVMGYESESDVLDHAEKVRNGTIDVAGHASCLSQYDPLLVPSHVNEADHNVVRFECWAPYDYDWSPESKRKISQQCFDLWKRYAPNLENVKIRVDISRSPQDIENQISTMKKGSIKHGEYTSLQMGYNRPSPECSSYSTPVDGFYVGGASTHPGGMIILGPGYNVARQVCRDLDGTKWWSEPDMVRQAQKNGYLPEEFER